MKKIILYVFFILMFCNIAYATPIEALVQSIIMTILSVVGLVVVNGFFETNINPFIPFGIIYGIYIFFLAITIIQYIKSSSKEKKELYGSFFDSIFFFVPPILVLAWLFIYRQ